MARLASQRPLRRWRASPVVPALEMLDGRGGRGDAKSFLYKPYTHAAAFARR